jgi:hypothetical protein
MAGWSKRDRGRHDNCELERPDRTRVGARRKDIPKSGKAWDSFPSGHAVHVGALAAAATRMAPQHASHVRSSALALAGTPILLLAHHLTGVIAGCLRLSAVRSVDRRSPSGPRGCGRGLVLCQPRSSCGRLSRERQREASLQRDRRDAQGQCGWSAAARRRADRCQRR